MVGTFIRHDSPPKEMSDKSAYNPENFPTAANYIAVATFYL
jgi:hypothetical protein